MGPVSFRETCQWLKFPLNGLRTQSRVSSVVGFLTLASGSASLRMAFPPFLVKQLYRCDSVVLSSSVRTGYTTRRWGWLWGRIGYGITHHNPLYPSCFIISLLYSSTCFEHYVLIIRGSKLYYTASGIVTMKHSLVSVLWYQMLYNTILTFWWWAHSARNM